MRDDITEQQTFQKRFPQNDPNSSARHLTVCRLLWAAIEHFRWFYVYWMLFLQLCQFLANLNHFNCNFITEKLWHILMKSLDFSICILYKYTSLESLELSKEMLLANITFVVDWDLLSGWLECCDNSPRRRDWYCPLFSYIFPSPIHIRKYGNYSQILK